ncbi:MAG: hypothetical protein ACI8PZ_001376 [Myxococcota bacterium]|jgi:hypothetical protein
MTFLLFLTACIVHQGNGDAAQQRRSVAPFDAVHATSNVDVDIAVGGGNSGGLVDASEADSVTVRCDSNLLGDIITEVRGTTLVVRTRQNVSLSPRTPCVVEAHPASLVEIEATGSGDMLAWRAVDLARVVTSGSGDVDVSGVDAPALEVRTSGSGDVSLDGAVRDLSLTTTGSGDVHARGLTAADGDLRSTGSGDIDATVTGRIDVSSSGSGDIMVWGSPVVGRRSSTGSGDITLR